MRFRKKGFFGLAIGIIPALMTMFLSSCATVMSHPTQAISIRTNPENATVIVYDRNRKKVMETITPAQIQLKRGSGFFRGASYTIEIMKEGYGKRTVTISPILNGGWYIGGNILIGGLIGIVIVDPLTGAMWNLSPHDINQTLSSGDSKQVDKTIPEQTVTPGSTGNTTADGNPNRGKRQKAIN